jgi:hypothetical protein
MVFFFHIELLVYKKGTLWILSYYHHKLSINGPWFSESYVHQRVKQWCKKRNFCDLFSLIDGFLAIIDMLRIAPCCKPYDTLLYSKPSIEHGLWYGPFLEELAVDGFGMFGFIYISPFPYTIFDLLDTVFPPWFWTPRVGAPYESQELQVVIKQFRIGKPCLQ